MNKAKRYLLFLPSNLLLCFHFFPDWGDFLILSNRSYLSLFGRDFLFVKAKGRLWGEQLLLGRTLLLVFELIPLSSLVIAVL